MKTGSTFTFGDKMCVVESYPAQNRGECVSSFNVNFSTKYNIPILVPRRAMSYKQKRENEWDPMPVHCILSK